MRNRRWRVAFVVFATLFVMAFVAISPAIVRLIAPQGMSWAQLSEIGQTYAGASAVLSALTLCGIVASLLLQCSQNRTNETYIITQRQLDLVRFTLENPKFAYSWGEMPDSKDYELRVFCNLIVNHWYLLWRIGDLSEETLRTLASRFFRSSVSREYWADVPL